MKHSLIIAASNLARLLPVTIISVLFTLLTTKSNYWAGNMAIFFLCYWAITTGIDVNHCVREHMNDRKRANKNGK